MGGRSSSFGGSSSAKYASGDEANNGLGYGNGGETDQWMGRLTDEESQAVSDYSADAYIELNEALRQGRDFHDDDDEYDYSALDASLEKALDKFELKKKTMFTRGSSAGLLGGADTVEDINAMKGNIVHDPGYTSTAATSSGSFDWEAITYHIETPKGKGIGAYINGLSGFKDVEYEFLFNKGSAFKVLGAYEDSRGGVHCNLRYMGRVK